MKTRQITELRIKAAGIAEAGQLVGDPRLTDVGRLTDALLMRTLSASGHMRPKLMWRAHRLQPDGGMGHFFRRRDRIDDVAEQVRALYESLRERDV